LERERTPNSQFLILHQNELYHHVRDPQQKKKLFTLKISNETFIRVRHLLTRRWLSLNRSLEVPGTEAHLHQSDVFKIAQAFREDVWEANFMSSCSQIIKDGTRLIRQIRKRKQRSGNYRLLHSNKRDFLSIIKCLDELKEFCYHYMTNGKRVTLNKENRKKQTKLRKDGFLKLLATLLVETLQDQSEFQMIEKATVVDQHQKSSFQATIQEEIYEDAPDEQLIQLNVV
jgi:hypothetical protein